MQTIEKETTSNEITRKITDTYTVENYRVKVSTWHDKNRKAYLTSVSECRIDKRDGYTMEFHGIFADYYKTIKAERVSRYSFTNLQKFHNDSADEVAAIVNQLLDNYKGEEE